MAVLVFAVLAGARLGAAVAVVVAVAVAFLRERDAAATGAVSG